MLCTSLSLLSFTIMQYRCCTTLPTLYTVKCNRVCERQSKSLLYNGIGSSNDTAVASVLYSSVRFLGSTGMAGSISTENISLSGQGSKLELVQLMPPILAAAEMESNHLEEEYSKTSGNVASIEHKSACNASSNNNAKEKEETIIDFTQPEKAALLEQHLLEKERKMYADKSLHYHKTCLTELERRNLVNMIYNTHYKQVDNEYEGSAVEKVNEDAELLWDEACMELKEITKWACKVEFQEWEQLEQHHQGIREGKQLKEEEQHEQFNCYSIKSKNENSSSSDNNNNINTMTFANVTDNNQESAKHETVDKHQESIRKRIKRAVLERVDLHKPLSYIIGNQPFYDCEICCTAPLLCPRPETEMWVHWYVQQHLKPVIKS